MKQWYALYAKKSPYWLLFQLALAQIEYDIKNNACVTVNNDFAVTSETICQDKLTQIICGINWGNQDR